MTLLGTFSTTKKCFPNSLFFQLKGVGIGNGWISPKYQSTYDDFLYNLGLIKKSKKTEFRLYRHMFTGNQSSHWTESEREYNMVMKWHFQLEEIRGLLHHWNIYDLRKSNIDLTEKNFWYFLQQPHVRKAIHVGDTQFDDGMDVSQ